MKQYIAIDLKSFYASVECAEKGLNPLTTNLVVADASRTEKTICLAVSPSLKAYGIPGRARLFEVVERVKQVNNERRMLAPGHTLSGSSYISTELDGNPALELSYITATPRMALYMEYSTRIFKIYMRHIAPEDIHVYSVDEVFIDATHYLNTYGVTAHELAMRMIKEVLTETGITATAGIGTNLYLAKIAMDIVAKHIEPDADGVRIAELDEMSYREKLWSHRPLTDFWRVGRGYSRKLEGAGLYTMGDIARLSIENEDILYKMFGINAELLIDHAWGWEPVGIEDIKMYKPQSNSLSSGQVLSMPYTADKARIVTMEMTDALVLSLVEKHLVTDQMVLTVCYDIDNLTDPEKKVNYKGEVKADHYGRLVPKPAHGTANLGKYTSSSSRIIDAVTQLYDNIVDKGLLVRRIYVVAARLKTEEEGRQASEFVQLDLMTDLQTIEREEKQDEREKNLQKALLDIKKKYGKNAVLKGTNFVEGATMKSRNEQIGGHRA